MEWSLGWLVQRHAGFVPARQSLLGFRLRSPLLPIEEPCPLSLQTVFPSADLRLSLHPQLKSLTLLIN